MAISFAMSLIHKDFKVWRGFDAFFVFCISSCHWNKRIRERHHWCGLQSTIVLKQWNIWQKNAARISVWYQLCVCFCVSLRIPHEMFFWRRMGRLHWIGQDIATVQKYHLIWNQKWQQNQIHGMKRSASFEHMFRSVSKCFFGPRKWIVTKENNKLRNMKLQKISSVWNHTKHIDEKLIIFALFFPFIWMTPRKSNCDQRNSKGQKDVPKWLFSVSIIRALDKHKRSNDEMTQNQRSPPLSEISPPSKNSNWMARRSVTNLQ